MNLFFFLVSYKEKPLMKTSAGILFIHENEVLLAHSTGAPWFGSWMPPKGGVNVDETLKQAAIRETEEEIGVRVSFGLLNRSFVIDYTDKKGLIYKQAHIFPIKLIYKDFEMNPGIQRTGDLQKEEIDKIDWFDYQEVEKRALYRYIKTIQNEILT